jgi:hypothetical protein
VSSSPTPRPEPTRSRSAANLEALTDNLRATRVVALAALVVAIAAVGFAAVQLLAPTTSCQDEAWNVQPSSEDLPAGWLIAATQYDLSRKTMSFTGPYPEDEFSTQASVISTITCFPQGAADAVTRSQQASEDADQTVIVRDDLGDQAYSAIDDSGATFLQLRKGPVVVYLAGSPDTSETEVDQIASAFDLALGGDGGTITPPTVAPSDDLGLESFDPEASASQAAPDLVAMLPTEVGDLMLVADSATGSSFLGDDQGSRAVTATLREVGREPDDLRVAQAYDELGASDLSILLVTVDGMPVEQTQAMVLDVWLAATGPGVTQEPVELAGKTFTRIDYGDDGLVDYVRNEGEVVLVITTADPDLAEETAAAMP